MSPIIVGAEGQTHLCLVLPSNFSITGSEGGKESSDERFGKRACAADNIVLLPFPMRVPVTPIHPNICNWPLSSSIEVCLLDRARCGVSWW